MIVSAAYMTQNKYIKINPNLILFFKKIRFISCAQTGNHEMRNVTKRDMLVSIAQTRSADPAWCGSCWRRFWLGMPDILSAVVTNRRLKKAGCLQASVMETNTFSWRGESVDAFGFTHRWTCAASICLNAVARVSLMPFITNSHLS